MNEIKISTRKKEVIVELADMSSMIIIRNTEDLNEEETVSVIISQSDLLRFASAIVGALEAQRRRDVAMLRLPVHYVNIGSTPTY